jgi:hypothetical protein
MDVEGLFTFFCLLLLIFFAEFAREQEEIKEKK